LRTSPGVIDAAAVRCAPGASNFCGDWFYSIPGEPVPAENEVPVSLFNGALPGYFQMMKVPLIEGREFNASDAGSGQNPVVINQTLARTWWPDEPAVGHHIKFGGPYREGDLLQIIGVVGDVKQHGLDVEPAPEIYTSAFGDRSLTIMVRGAAGV